MFNQVDDWSICFSINNSLRQHTQNIRQIAQKFLVWVLILPLDTLFNSVKYRGKH